jgi:hypothetical protein
VCSNHVPPTDSLRSQITKSSMPFWQQAHSQADAGDPGADDHDPVVLGHSSYADPRDQALDRAGREAQHAEGELDSIPTGTMSWFLVAAVDDRLGHEDRASGRIGSAARPACVRRPIGADHARVAGDRRV